MTPLDLAKWLMWSWYAHDCYGVMTPMRQELRGVWYNHLHPLLTVGERQQIYELNCCLQDYDD